jgi:hypothetical protein
MKFFKDKLIRGGVFFKREGFLKRFSGEKGDPGLKVSKSQNKANLT